MDLEKTVGKPSFCWNENTIIIAMDENELKNNIENKPIQNITSSHSLYYEPINLVDFITFVLNDSEINFLL
ncbi:hypothetical protein HZS_6966, partial [Henneguya salminicola]